MNPRFKIELGPTRKQATLVIMCPCGEFELRRPYDGTPPMTPEEARTWHAHLRACHMQ